MDSKKEKKVVTICGKEYDVNMTTKLNLCRKNLTEFPSNIKYLTNLEILWLNNNQIKVIPPEIKYLTKLKTFSIIQNQVSIIPPEIKYLTNLQILSFSSNIIKIIPSEIKFLVNLQYLDFTLNRITRIPPEICFLTKLWGIDLSHNYIKVIPSEIKFLNLCEFRLNNNLIEYIPIEIKFLTELDSLWINNNPLPFKIEPNTSIYLENSSLGKWFKMLDHFYAIKIQTCYRKWKYRRALDKHLYPVLTNIVVQYLP